MSEIGEQIHEKRLNKKLSLRKLSGKTGIAVSTIFRIEKGVSNPNSSTLKVINDVLDKETIKNA